MFASEVPRSTSGTARWQVSNIDGREPVWAHNGRELFYREASGVGTGPSMMVATYSTESGFRIESRERLFDASQSVTIGLGGSVHAPRTAAKVYAC